MRRVIFWVPLALVVMLLVSLGVGLMRPEGKVIPSRMVGRPMPDFTLPGAVPGVAGLASADLGRGRPRLVNIFASWCVPCAAEAPQLMALRRAGIEVDGIAIRDAPAPLALFLQRYGNPYRRVGADNESRVQIALGSSGVPESFLIDGEGIILEQHIGDIRADEVADIVAKLKGAK